MQRTDNTQADIARIIGCLPSACEVSDFKQQQLEKDAAKNWDKFYQRNTTKFFKDRHWTKHEFVELCSDFDWQNEALVLLEAGCGVGNLIFPLLEEFPRLYVYACDFSRRAVQHVVDNPAFDSQRCKAFQCDLTADQLDSIIAQNSVDLCTLVFVFSAIHPEKMVIVADNIFRILRPGGSVLLRDYAVNDHAMLRFSERNKLGENFYVRQDGTRSYYFSLEKLHDIFQAAGFTVKFADYIHRTTVNHKEDLCVSRRFVQARFRKPQSTVKSMQTF